MSTFAILLSVTGASFCFGQASQPSAQSPQNPAPQLPPGFQPGQKPPFDPSKLKSTGLKENGGSFENGVYSNSIYNFSWKIPLGWVFAPLPKKVEVPVSDKDSIAKHMQVTRVLMIATENAPLKRGNERKSIQVVATQLRSKPGPGAELDFITYSENAAKEKGMAVEYFGNPELVRIYGHQFGKIRFNDSTRGFTQHVEQYVALQNQNLLQFLLVSPDDTGLRDLQPSIQSLKFQASKGAHKTPASKGKSSKNGPGKPN